MSSAVTVTDEGSLGAYLHGWLERQQTQLQPGTWVSYRGIVQRYLLPHLGDVALAALAKRDIEALYARLFVRGGAGGRPLSKRTVAFAHAVLHKALEDAVRDDLLVRNPSHRAVLPKRSTTRRCGCCGMPADADLLRRTPGPPL